MTLEFDDRSGDDRFFLTLQPTEQSILAAASRLLAARLASGQCTPDHVKTEMRWAIRVAIEMANIVDVNVRCEHEM